ncbi:preprotein translocase subunit SecE [Deferribacterales bacterium RsTz2092]|nr:protein translocase subunit SecE [Deferribacterales bacterium]
MGIDKALAFYNEVKGELEKVSWPTKQQTIGTTAVVLVLMAILTVYLGIADAVLARLATVVMG